MNYRFIVATLVAALSMQCLASFHTFRKPMHVPAKQGPKKITWAQIALKIDDLVKAIKAEDWNTANNIADEFLDNNIEQQVVDLAKRDFASSIKDIQKLFEDRKKAKKEAEERALQERRKEQATSIRKKAEVSTPLPSGVCGIVAEYAVD